MKNIKNNQLKTCIFLTSEEFNDIIREIFGNDVFVEYAYDGFRIFITNSTVDTDDLYEALCKYFGVKEIEWVHTDHCEYIGVWITYKN